MTRYFLTLTAILCVSTLCARAQSGAPSADTSRAIEIVKQDIDLEVAADGRSWEVREIRARPLTALGVKALQQRTLSYTYGYQTLRINAYTLKKDGRQIPIPQSEILQGHGETTAPGFADTRTLTVVFPNLEVGDQMVLITASEQLVPWFPNTFSILQNFPESVVVRESRFAFTSRGDDSIYHIVASGVTADAPVTLGGKTRHVWHFHNDNPKEPDPGAVEEYADQPRVEITNLAGYSQVAKIYADLFRDRAQVTPEISALADKLTAGLRSHRDQAKALYEWVSAHIEYVNIVLGAGGFVPHQAKDVLKNGYGDCKDHVMLLQALLAAKGIKSSAVLIRAGADQFKLPLPSPFLFDHLISYVPELNLFLDSTARYAPFAVLPMADAGKSVVVVETGATATTPAVSVNGSSISAVTDLTINADGSADAETRIVASGAIAIDLRGQLAEATSDADAEFFRAYLGPGSEGKFIRPANASLDGKYEYSAKYHHAHLANLPGPGALPAALAYKPFSFSLLVGSTLPAERARDYLCPSGSFREVINLAFPNGVELSSVPPSKTFTTAGVELHTDFKQTGQGRVTAEVDLKLDHAGPVCRAADYAKIRPDLSKMVGALQAQILYK